MTEKEAENAPDVIKGMASICNKPACVLIDPGATFSFISSTFVLLNKLELFDRGEPVLVSMPMGVSVICDKITKGVIVKIGEDELEWEFMPLPLSDFDAILGMDGLSRYKASVDCFKRKVIFEKEDGVKVCFEGDSQRFRLR